MHNPTGWTPSARSWPRPAPPIHGLTYTARALAAWWRLPNAEGLLSRFDPTTLAAVDRAIRYWSGASKATYPDAARTFLADEGAVRKVTPILQKQLQLTTARIW